MSSLVRYQASYPAVLSLHCVSRRSPTGEYVSLPIHERHHAVFAGSALACISVVNADEQVMDMWNLAGHTHDPSLAWQILGI